VVTGFILSGSVVRSVVRLEEGVMPEFSAAEVREEHQRVLGQELGDLYHALWQEAVWLHFEWQQYLKLFGQEQQGLDLLNEAAGALFYVVQKTLLDSVVLSIARLTGPLQSSGQDNLTLRRLRLHGGDPDVARSLDELIAARAPAWAFVGPWRNKRLAHRDLETALERRATSLPPITRADVEGALAAIRDTLNFIQKRYFQSEVLYKLREPRDADALVHLLTIGLREDNARLERLRAGHPRREDLD
jgi:hypothetical protein